MKQWKKGTVTLACEELKEHIAGKRIALMMNTSAIDNEGRLLIDVIVKEKWAEVAFFFGMEHGVRGNLYAGNGDNTDVDDATGVKIISLYPFPGLRPPVELVEQVDAVVFCAQDVGVRHWTYTPWMMTLIDSCAKADREVIVLDRPNPIRGDIVEGAPGEKYVGGHLLSGFDYPLRHGMTVGELALMYNEEKKIGAKLTVLKMKGWKRDMWYDETGLIWLPPSPNMPTVDTALYFAATGLIQSSNISKGLGTTTPFQYIGRPEFSGDTLAEELNSRGLEGVFFVPKYYMASVVLEKGRPSELALCDGVMMVIHDRNNWRPVHTQLNIFDALIKLYPDIIDLEVDTRHARVRMCTDKICDAALRRESLQPVIEEWQQGAEEFMKRREKYLLY